MLGFWDIKDTQCVLSYLNNNQDIFANTILNPLKVYAFESILNFEFGSYATLKIRFRSNRSQIFFKIGVLKNFANFIENNCAVASF